MPKIKGINMNKNECYDLMTECKLFGKKAIAKENLKPLESTEILT